MLIFVKSSTDASAISPNIEADSTLLELAKDPSSEAVFATMAIQLEAKGGFSKVLGLLSELVHDSKAQLHSMTKLWRGVSARCQVSKIKLAGRQEFFETYLAQAQRHVRHAKLRLGECNDHLKGFRKSKSVYSLLLKTEIARHNQGVKALKLRYGHVQKGIKSLNNARKAIKDWSPKGKALIQTHLSEVSNSYLQVKEYELPSVTNFLEKTTDVKVRARLLEWISQVGAQLIFAGNEFQSALKRLKKLGGAVEVALANMIKAIKAGVKHLLKAIAFCRNTITSGKKTVALYQQLVGFNKSLIRANNKYCENEKTNYNKNRIQAKSAITLFREVRKYFLDNYKKLHSYIKAKYHKY